MSERSSDSIDIIRKIHGLATGSPAEAFNALAASYEATLSVGLGMFVFGVYAYIHRKYIHHVDTEILPPNDNEVTSAESPIRFTLVVSIALAVGCIFVLAGVCGYLGIRF